MPDRKKTEARINEAARAWKAAEAIPGNEAAALKLRNDVWEWAEKLYNPEKGDPEEEAFISDTILSCIMNFRADSGAFCNYLSFVLKKRREGYFKKLSEKEAFEVSLSAPVSASAGDGDGELTRADMIPSDTDVAGQSEGRVYVSSLLVEMTSLVLDFYGRHTGRAANEGRRMWYRLFFTEDVTYVCRDEPRLLKHPRDVFQAMDLGYLDHYMSAPCRTPDEVWRTPPKPYCQIVPGSDDERVTWLTVPFPGDVSLFYLLKTTGTMPGRSARSNQLKFYREELNGLL